MSDMNALQTLQTHKKFRIQEGLEIADVASAHIYRVLEDAADDQPLVCCLELSGSFRIVRFAPSVLKNPAAFRIRDSLSTAHALERQLQGEFFTLCHSRGFEQRLDVFGAQYKARTRAQLYAKALLAQWAGAGG